MLNKSYIWRYMYGVTQMNKWCFKDLDCIFQDDLIQVCSSSLGMSLLELRKRSLGRAACTSCVPQFCVNQVISLAYLSLSASMTCYPWDSLFIPRCQMADICCSTCSHRRAHVTGLQSLLVCLLNIFTRVSRAIKNDKIKIKRKKESSAKYI